MLELAVKKKTLEEIQSHTTTNVSTASCIDHE